MKLSDYVAQKLVDHGVRHVFMITGGGAMHLNVSLGTHPQLETIFNHHEQACAIAAESYARLTGRMAAVSVTSGPGGTNALTGVLGGYLDSIPMLIISGQVRYDTTAPSTGLPLRQLGDQEYDITRVVTPLTKYAAMVTDPREIRYHLERSQTRPTPAGRDPVGSIFRRTCKGRRLLKLMRRPTVPEEDAQQVPPPVKEETVREIIGRLRAARRPCRRRVRDPFIGGAMKTFSNSWDC